MPAKTPGTFKRWMARVCARCPVCRRARLRQQGWALALVQRVEGRACPFCRAYAEVYGQPPHAPARPGSGEA